MFIKKQRVGSYEYYQAVESYRNEEGKPRQRVVVHLGKQPTLEAAIEAQRRRLGVYRQIRSVDFTKQIARCEERLEKLNRVAREYGGEL